MKRKTYIDVLNVLGILMVIMLHSNAGIRFFNGEVSLQFLWSTAVHSFANWPVNVFYGSPA